MRTKLGIISIIIGLIFILSALGLLIYNDTESARAEQRSFLLLEIIKIQLSDSGKKLTENENDTYVEPEDTEFPCIDIDGVGYVGYISIPDIGIELPVALEYTDKQLKSSLCLYCTEGSKLVIAGHNFTSHLGKLSRLEIGAEVYFTDVRGNTIEYKVYDFESIKGNDITAMVESDYDLTLFTCDYSGKNRFTVRCVKDD